MYFRKQWSGVDTPKGSPRLFNAYSGTGQRYTSSRITYVDVNGGFLGSSEPQEMSMGSTPPAWTANDEIDLLNKVAKRLKGHQFNAGVFLGTFHQSFNMLYSAATNLFGLYRAVRRGDVGGAVRSLTSVTFARNIQNPAKMRNFTKKLRARDISGAWLAAQYGWIPLASDIYEAAGALDSLLFRREIDLRVSKRVWSVIDDSTSPSLWTAPAVLERKVTLFVKLEENPGTLNGLGLLDPLSVAWELLPFSFVVDWFLPIGNYLEAKSYFCLAGPIYADRVDFWRNSVSSLSWIRRDWGSGWFVTQKPAYTKSVWGLLRTPRSQLVVPLPNFKAISQAMSLGHIKNAAALIHQLTDGLIQRKLKR